MTLVMIQRKHSTVFPHIRLMKNRIRTYRSFYVKTFFLHLLNCRRNYINLFITEKAMLSTVWVKTCNSKCTLRRTYSVKCLGAANNIIFNFITCNGGYCITQRKMTSQKENSQTSRLKHSKRIFSVGKSSVNFRMTDKRHISRFECLLVNRSCSYTVRLAFAAKQMRRLDTIVSRLTCKITNLACCFRSNFSFARHVVYKISIFAHKMLYAALFSRLLQNIGITYKQGFTLVMHALVCNSSHCYFRSYSARIAHCYCYYFFIENFRHNTSLHFKFLNIVTTKTRTVKQAKAPDIQKCKNLLFMEK